MKAFDCVIVKFLVVERRLPSHLPGRLHFHLPKVKNGAIAAY